MRSSKVPTGTYFADWVAPSARDAFETDFGEVKVPTTLDADLQRLAVRVISRAQIGDAQAALVAMRPDGRVVAMVGRSQLPGEPVQPRNAGSPATGFRIQALRLSRRRFAQAGPPTASSRTGPSPSTAGPRRTAIASTAARSPFARRSPVRATPLPFACRRVSAGLTSARRAGPGDHQSIFRTRPASRLVRPA